MMPVSFAQLIAVAYGEDAATSLNVVLGVGSTGDGASLDEAEEAFGTSQVQLGLWLPSLQRK